MKLGTNFSFTTDWDNVTTVGDYCFNNMFYTCTKLKALPVNFTIPQNIRATGGAFCDYMFFQCTSLASLPDGFTLPQNMPNASWWFCRHMFSGCSSLGALPDNFNLPQNVTSVGDSFCNNMFNGCNNDNFRVNDAFRFPLLPLSELNKSFLNMFYCSANKIYPRQNISAATILNGNPTPSTNKHAFFTCDATQGANRWSDYNSLPTEWK